MSEIYGLFEFTSNVSSDYRGMHRTLWSQDGPEYAYDIPEFKEDEISISYKNVIRGMHGNFTTGKLLQCLQGSIYLQVMDIRKESETYHNVFTITLDDIMRTRVYIPPGCINGHLCISDICILHYKLTEPYSKSNEQITVNPFDNHFFWPVSSEVAILSGRDRHGQYI